eukprot:gene3697-6242_t
MPQTIVAARYPVPACGRYQSGHLLSSHRRWCHHVTQSPS